MYPRAPDVIPDALPTHVNVVGDRTLSTDSMSHDGTPIDAMQIFVRYDAHTWPLTVAVSLSMSQFMTRIQNIIGIPTGQQHLFLRGKQLKEVGNVAQQVDSLCTVELLRGPSRAVPHRGRGMWADLTETYKGSVADIRSEANRNREITLFQQRVVDMGKSLCASGLSVKEVAAATQSCLDEAMVSFLDPKYASLWDKGMSNAGP